MILVLRRDVKIRTMLAQKRMTESNDRLPMLMVDCGRKEPREERGGRGRRPRARASRRESGVGTGPTDQRRRTDSGRRGWEEGGRDRRERKKKKGLVQ